MAQILKDDVKSRIIESAKEEFQTNSYEKTSMRNIASKSNITVGNLYRYFKSKEDLSSFIVGPALEKINRLVRELTNNQVDIYNTENISLTTDQIRDMLDKLGDGIVDIYLKHRIEVNILMMREEVTRSMVNWFAEALGQIISSNYSIDEKSEELKLMAASYAESIFRGLAYMLRNNKLDTDTLKRVVKVYMESYVDMLDMDLVNKLKGE
ncbi:MAG: TetR/AcrR family transcriptional regulator [Erysipelotrichaceae bacterium]|nr:TetR/AcrR family transcriptional regulator [Erysipelotrichaceae bacterium]